MVTTILSLNQLSGDHSVSALRLCRDSWDFYLSFEFLTSIGMDLVSYE